MTDCIRRVFARFDALRGPEDESDEDLSYDASEELKVLLDMLRDAAAFVDDDETHDDEATAYRRRDVVRRLARFL